MHKTVFLIQHAFGNEAVKYVSVKRYKLFFLETGKLNAITFQVGYDSIIYR